MKQDYPSLGIKTLCRLFGKTRHAWYDYQWRFRDMCLKDEIILQHVLRIRGSLPRTGTLKLLHMITPMLAEHGIRVGRDYLFDLMREHGLDIRRRRRRVVTTDSRHWMHKYANLVKELEVNRPEQAWVSDITYIRMNNGWGYLSLVTDAYSRKIMGYCFHRSLAAQGCVEALKMALDQRSYNGELVHHSDRGSQYCSSEYVEVLISNRVAISMTENGDPYENALAERVNGILKEEFNLHYSGMGFQETERKIAESIRVYNEVRPHASCDYLT
ncbi:IS3 family transposase, partial [Parapedobacter sp. DT-150]|uniref:IS3 family transposase n=1 Tax=Parapedobacter sp. DT-150 TaxID=3396162 RepID=UPI003F1D1EA4